MLRKSSLLFLRSIKIQYLAIFKESKEFMSDVLYLRFSMLLARHLFLAIIKSKPRGWINIFPILLVCIRHFLRHQPPIQNSDKLDVRTTRINLLIY